MHTLIASERGFHLARGGDKVESKNLDPCEGDKTSGSEYDRKKKVVS
jgi:hypothetical protein